MFHHAPGVWRERAASRIALARSESTVALAHELSWSGVRPRVRATSTDVTAQFQKEAAPLDALQSPGSPVSSCWKRTLSHPKAAASTEVQFATGSESALESRMVVSEAAGSTKRCRMPTNDWVRRKRAMAELSDFSADLAGPATPTSVRSIPARR